MTTLATLRTSVDSWLARDDVAVSNTDFPVILLMAESDIARDLRTVAQETQLTLTCSDRFTDLPQDFLEVRNPFIDDNIRRFEYMTPQAIRESSAWSNRGQRVGAFYTLEGGGKDVSGAGDDRVALVLAAAPTASEPIDVDINYYRRFPALQNDTDTNWLMQNHFDIYLYATLRASCEYIQEDVLEDRYAAKYDRAVEKQQKAENRKRYTAVPKQAYASPRGIV